MISHLPYQPQGRWLDRLLDAVITALLNIRVRRNERLYQDRWNGLTPEHWWKD